MSERERYWRERMADLESSGLSRAAFCRQHEINYQSMSAWVKRLRSEDGAARFVEVSVPTVNTAASAPPAYEVRLGSDRSIRITGDFDGAVLTRLIQTIESC